MNLTDTTPRGELAEGSQGKAALTNQSTVRLLYQKLPSLNLKSRGLSNAYSLFVGFLGIAMFGIAYTIIDQIGLGDVWNFAVTQQEDGSQLNIFKMMFSLIPIVTVFTFVIGQVVQSHKARNEA